MPLPWAGSFPLNNSQPKGWMHWPPKSARTTFNGNHAKVLQLPASQAHEKSAACLAFNILQRQNSSMAHRLTTSYTKDVVDLFRYYKGLAERAIQQCPEESLFSTLDAESNSIAIIVKHMTGNMRSRWTDFLTTDGEKPDRNRDSEFEEPPRNRAELIAMWERGWKILFDALEPLTEADLARTITIRTEPHSVMQAINRQIAHYSYHVGQIAFSPNTSQKNPQETGLP
jgi:Protein of unknown function (DUF1572)